MDKQFLEHLNSMGIVRKIFDDAYASYDYIVNKNYKIIYQDQLLVDMITEFDGYFKITYNGYIEFENVEELKDLEVFEKVKLSEE